MLSKYIFSLTFYAFLWCSFHCLLVAGNTSSDTEFARINVKVAASSDELNTLILQAREMGLCTDYAEVSAHTIAIFRKAARSDYDNDGEVLQIFKDFKRIKEPRTSEEAKKLPFNELRACLDVAENAQQSLQAQIDGSIVLTAPPNLAKGTVSLGSGYYELDGRPIFPSTMVWLNDDEDYWQSYGRVGQGYYTFSNLLRDGAVDPKIIARNMAAAKERAKQNLAPCVTMIGHMPARWMRTEYPEILQGGRNFTQYDIDNPQVRIWMQCLIEGLLPTIASGHGDQPQVHLLANEPHFATEVGGWLSKNGLSDFTMAKYHQWLEAKYSNIETLNQVYQTHYAEFEAVVFYDEKSKKYKDEPYRARQISAKQYRGGAVWYDWCRFNQARVNEWFTFLKEQVQANDGIQAPVTIKMLGHSLSASIRDGGMDVEYLTQLQDVMGADLRVIPQGTEVYGKHEEGLDLQTSWTQHFAYDWSDQSMYLDFSKSLCPDKAFYDSEWHGFGAVSWRHFSMSREYVRSALWMAFTDGMGMIKPWVWGRTDEGALTKKTDHIGELSTQPVAVDAYARTMKELNAHADWLAPSVRQPRDFMIFYCEESAIQDGEYTQGFKNTYEALKLMNLAVGFTTPTEIAKLDPKAQTVLVTPTPFISDNSLAALHAFQERGGRLVLVGAEGSFLKNEQGFKRGATIIAEPYAKVPTGYAMDLIDSFDAVLALLAVEPPLQIEITDEPGEAAYGVMIKQLRHPRTGQLILVLNNVSKDRRAIQLKPESRQSNQFTDMINRQSAETSFTMAPCAVRVLLSDN